MKVVLPGLLLFTPMRAAADRAGAQTAPGGARRDKIRRDRVHL
jgi:hypothetical protein